MTTDVAPERSAARTQGQAVPRRCAPSVIGWWRRILG